MKVFVAGATGVLGRSLVPQLVARGHEVVGMTRSASKQDLMRSLGARPVVADALDPGAVAQAVVPRWLGRLLAGETATAMMTEARGASNEKAKRELGWQLRYPSWRQGFAQGLG
jgi:nucleoside-diphosphate-sugar epimerase